MVVLLQCYERYVAPGEHSYKCMFLIACSCFKWLPGPRTVEKLGINRLVLVYKGKHLGDAK